mgnify:CR=1 FL=1
MKRDEAFACRTHTAEHSKSLYFNEQYSFCGMNLIVSAVTRSSAGLSERPFWIHSLNNLSLIHI